MAEQSEIMNGKILKDNYILSRGFSANTRFVHLKLRNLVRLMFTPLDKTCSITSGKTALAISFTQVYQQVLRTSKSQR